MIYLHDLKPAAGAKHPKKRVGRGIGGKGGKTAGRGTKGQGARDTIPVGFEGGQLPLTQRIPKLKGFANPFRVEYSVVGLDDLAKFVAAGATVVDVDALVAAGVVRKGTFVKVLANGELPAAVTVKAHRFSKSARERIESVGGTVEQIELPFKAGRPAARGNALMNR